MNKHEEYSQAKRQIVMETDAEIAFGQLLEGSGVDFEKFMEQWALRMHSSIRSVISCTD